METTTTKQDEIIEFLKSKKTTDFVNISPLMATLFPKNEESGKNLIKKMKSENLIDFTGDLYKINTTQGGQIPNYVGEMVDAPIEYGFKNVEIKAKLLNEQ